ncbi:hypothetical protein B0J14DRAFT_573294 [Halenospora varia]|nr:hypothetical protein B0J14DRAFT_573294 [Halenospora varia]
MQEERKNLKRQNTSKMTTASINPHFETMIQHNGKIDSPYEDKQPSFRHRLFKHVSNAPSDRKYGIKIFHDPSDAVVDIVFVHGITGHREHTWSSSKHSRPWPETLLPSKIPEARIFSVGYDAAVLGWRSKISSNRIGDHSKNLLAALATHRDGDHSSDRPIIFVAHSLGGLVCEDALLSSKASPEEHLQKIINCTWGILFLGTPHSGSGFASAAGRLVPIIRPATRTNLQIVNVLRRDSEVLARIQHEFHSLLRSRSIEGCQPIKITCFYEEVPLTGIGEVVPKHSAIIPGYTAIGIHKDHKEMARFAIEDDPGFISVVGELHRWVKEIKSLQSKLDSGVVGELFLNKGHNPNMYNVVPTGINICGDVLQSNVVYGSQVINGGLTFRD